MNVDFDNIDPTNAQIDDPLLTTGAPPNPLEHHHQHRLPGDEHPGDRPVHDGRRQRCHHS